MWVFACHHGGFAWGVSLSSEISVSPLCVNAGTGADPDERSCVREDSWGCIDTREKDGQ